MSTNIDRRVLLKGGIAGLIGLSLCPLAPALSATRTVAASRPLTDRLTLITGVGANVLALRTDEGLLLVDSGLSAHAGALGSQLKALGHGAAVHTLINTHCHPEQTGSNATLGKAGAQIIAHAKARQFMANAHYDPRHDSYVPALATSAIPTRVFYARDSLAVAGETVEFGPLLEAHTDGDSYVYFPGANVVATGDAASPERDPILDWYGGGWIGGRLDALTLLMGLGDDQTRFVPAQGPVVDKAALKAEHDMLDTLYTRMTTLLRKGYSAKDMLDAGVMKDLPRAFNDPQTFLMDAFRGLWAHHNTISSDIV